MKLRYVVITSVNRDDLADGGSHHFAETVREVRSALPEARVEVLTPDFCGDLDAVARVLDAGPHVFNHNMETVPRLYRRVRPQADYRQSLDVLAFARRHAPEVLTKSGFMVGLGETDDEVHSLLHDLHAQRNRLRDHRPVPAAYAPQSAGGRLHAIRRQFEAYRDYGLALGLRWCSAARWCAARIWPTRSVKKRDGPLAERYLSTLLNWAMALASAALLILAFPKFSMVWFAPVALAPLLVAAARETRPLRRFLLGWSAGVVYWFGICYWIQAVLAFVRRCG